MLPRRERLHYVFVAASLVGTVWLLWYRNLLVLPRGTTIRPSQTGRAAYSGRVVYRLRLSDRLNCVV